MRLMGDKGQHDEVGIQAVQAMALVGLPQVVSITTGHTNVFHDLVLAFTSHIVPCAVPPNTPFIIICNLSRTAETKTVVFRPVTKRQENRESASRALVANLASRFTSPFHRQEKHIPCSH